MYSAIPPQYVSASTTTFQHEDSGDVVIMVPSMDVPSNIGEQSTAIMGSGGGIDGSHEHSICIETEADIEPTSPKTMTESSSRFIFFVQ